MKRTEFNQLILLKPGRVRVSALLGFEQWRTLGKRRGSSVFYIKQ